jgi:SAM-dependent methyltransferase
MTQEPVATSFRDPSGRVFVLKDRVVRQVHEHGRKDLQQYLESPTIQKAIREGRAIDARRIDHEEVQSDETLQVLLGDVEEGELVEHEKIPLPSYPYEWSPLMLEAAARATLRLQENLLTEGRGLKDASAYNILFQGTRPVFIDALSVEKRDPQEALWSPEAQFSRMFLLPLLVARDQGLSLQETLLVHRDGLSPEAVFRMTPRLRRLRSPYLFLVTLPTWLAGKAQAKGEGLYEKKRFDDPQQARFVLETGIKRLRRQLAKVTPRKDRSNWTTYMESRDHYPTQAINKKDAFVEKTLKRLQPGTVLDIGCNTGHFSMMAAHAGARVVAIDNDPASIDLTWSRARSEDLDVLPLVVDLARPTPGMGWGNMECPSFLERAEGGFDLVLMLAVIHHLGVTERVPLAHVLEVASRLSRKHILIEHVGENDPLYRRLLRGRQDQQEPATREHFEAQVEARFRMLETRPLPGTSRTLYLLERLETQDPATEVPQAIVTSKRA